MNLPDRGWCSVVLILVSALALIHCGRQEELQLLRPESTPPYVWEKVRQPRAVSFSDETHGLAVGDRGLLLATDDGGATWTPLDLGIETDLRAVYFLDDDHGWAAGDEGVILSTANGGKTWARRDPPGTVNLKTVYFLDSDHGWAAGDEGVILKTTDSGLTWIRKDSLSRQIIYQVYFLNEDFGWARTSEIVLKTVDGGTNWFQAASAIDSRGVFPRSSNLLMKQKPVNLVSAHFQSATHGWAVGKRSTVLKTTDGGFTWGALGLFRETKFNSVYFADTRHGWIVGGKPRRSPGHIGKILVTADRGATWSNQEPSAIAELFSVYFPDKHHGWTVGGAGTILATSDGGVNWFRQESQSHTKFRSVYFYNTKIGWIVGDEGIILTTTDAGTAWNPQDSGTDADLHSVHFYNSKRGWAVGQEGVILHTMNGGASWTRQNMEAPSTPVDFFSVHFYDSQHGLIGGSRSYILSTNNGGSTWESQQINSKHGQSILSVTISDSRTAWAVGSGGIYLSPTHYAPFVTTFLPKADHTQIHWTAEAEKDPETIRCTLEFRVGAGKKWFNIAQDLAPSIVKGKPPHFTAIWEPSSEVYRIKPGKELHYRITLSDALHEAWTQEIPQSYRYKSYGRHLIRQWLDLGETFPGKLLQAGTIVIIAALLWISALATLLQVRPATILWLTRLPLAEFAKASGPTPWAAHLLEILVAISFGRYFARHPRTRRAWIERFSTQQATLDELDPEIRQHYLNQDDVLDAWVEQHARAVRAAFFSQDTVHTRQLHVPLPVQLGEKTLPQLSAQDLRSVFTQRGCLIIWGDGGTGKTSLACQLTSWALSDTPNERLAEHRMLPVLLEPGFAFDISEGQDLLQEAVRGQLSAAIGQSTPIPSDLLERLLRHRRILVILDSFSEMDEPTRQAIEPFKPEFSAHALVMTSRRRENLRVRITELKPLVVRRERLLSFLEAYFTRSGHQNLFNDTETFGACRRLAQMVGKRATTILFARLFADQMITAKHGGKELPATLPDLMLRYLNNLITKAPKDPRDIQTLHAAAKVVAWECLRATFRPNPATLSTTLKALGEEETANLLLSKLEHDLGIIRTVQPGEDQIRFTLDPLAEFLASLHLVEFWADDTERWHELLASAQEMDGAPDTVREFLLALRDCCLAKGNDYAVPAWLPDALAELVADDRSHRPGQPESGELPV